MYDCNNFMSAVDEDVIPVQKNRISTDGSDKPSTVVNGGRKHTTSPGSPPPLEQPLCHTTSTTKSDNSDENLISLSPSEEATISEPTNFVLTHDSIFHDSDFQYVFGCSPNQTNSNDTSENATSKTEQKKVDNVATNFVSTVSSTQIKTIPTSSSSFSSSTLVDLSFANEENINDKVQQQQQVIASTTFNTKSSSFKPLNHRFDSIDVVDLISDDEDDDGDSLDALRSVAEFPNLPTDFNRDDYFGYVTSVYSPTRLNPQTLKHIQTTVNSDVYQFVRVLLSFSITALNSDLYLEENILYRLQSQEMLKPDFNPDDDYDDNLLPLSYVSPAEYKAAYLPFIMLDGWAQLVDDWASTLFPAKHEMYVEKKDDERDYITLWLRALVHSTDVHFGKFGYESWIVLVHPDEGEGGPSSEEVKKPEPESANKMALGFVQAYHNKVKVYGDSASAPEHLNVLGKYNPEKKGYSLNAVEYVVRVAKSATSAKLFANKEYLSLVPVYYARPTLRYVETLSLMQFKDSFKDTFLQPKEEIFRMDFSRPDGFNFHEEASYNPEQKKAILSSVNAVELPYKKMKVVMIQGPPGTGKTHTLVGIVKNLFVNCTTTGSEPFRILICAPSNGAIDEIALRLIRDRHFLEQFKDEKLRIVRIGQKSQVHPDVQKYLLDNLVDRHFGQKSRSAKLREEILLNAHIILSTLNSSQLSCMSMFRTENISPQSVLRCVIVDEGGQSTEPEVLMPLIYPVSKLILIGDHLQLPATVLSRVGQRAGYGRSLFERLVRHFESTLPGGTVPMLTLVQQFRMHHAICAFPSKQFYKGALETPSNTGVNSAISLQPYFVFDIVNANEQQTSDFLPASRFNIQEVQFIFKLLLVIFNKLGYSVHEESVGSLPPTPIKTSIGVITFYRGQKDELVKRLQQFHGGALLKHVDVNTVDAFQGRERDITILSCVRAFDTAKECNSVGFVRSQQRMNVALTRSKSVLYVCMNGNSFTGETQWQQLIIDAMGRGRFVRITSKFDDEKLSNTISLFRK